MGIEPATVMHSGHLAAQFGRSGEHAQQQRLALTYDTTSPQGPSGTHMAMVAMRSELIRRNWA